MTERRLPSREEEPLIHSSNLDDDMEPHYSLSSHDSRSERNSSGRLSVLLSSVDSLMGSTRDLTTEIKGAVVEEVQTVADAFVEELREADQEDDKYSLLAMNLTRNFSILPADVANAATFVNAGEMNPSCTLIPIPGLYSSTVPPSRTSISAPSTEPPSMSMIAEGQEEEIPPPTLEKKLSAYFLLVSAVVALSAIGPALNLQQGAGSTLKVYWRTTATSIFLLPLAAHALYRDGLPRLTFSQLIKLFLAGASYTTMCVFFIWALDNTAVGNALILSNSQSLILLIGKIFIGTPISTLEAIGACVAFGGAVLCSKDSSDNSSSGGFKTFQGDIFAMLSSLGGVAYLIFAKTVRPLMDLYVFMFFIMLVGSMQTLFFIWVAGEPVSFSLDTYYGAFGWLSLQPDRLPLEVIIVVVCNLFGAMGYVRAMHYFDNLVISVASLMEPVVAEFLSFWLGLSSLPGTQGWIGNLLVILGTVAVVYQPSGKALSSAHS